ncbi:hypothetical protein GH714_013445 [Hevea brasiliensis]|uniref:Uncharacterized protein n=1 Tax=Hevea brasiliensis TaxID=3981 RepID=A0A6A6KEF1_HEVBR|nr:hypothetical protein GH714_013445 [Hevea brasiliensis]
MNLFPGQNQPIFSLGNQVTVTHEVVTTTTTKLLTSFVALEPKPRIMIQDHANVDNNQNLCLNQNDINFLEFNVSNRNQEKKRAAESELASRRNQEKKPAAESEVKVADVKIDRSSKMQGEGQYIINPEAPSNSLVDIFDMKQRDEECIVSPEAPSNFLVNVMDKMKGDGQYIINPEAPNSLVDIFDMKQGDEECIISPEAPSNYLANLKVKEEPIFM